MIRLVDDQARQGLNLRCFRDTVSDLRTTEMPLEPTDEISPRLMAAIRSSTPRSGRSGIGPQSDPSAARDFVLPSLVSFMKILFFVVQAIMDVLWHLTNIAPSLVTIVAAVLWRWHFVKRETVC